MAIPPDAGYPRRLGYADWVIRAASVESRNLMNPRGHPATLHSSQPGNRNAVKSGVYSRCVRAERVEEIRLAATGISTLALARAAVRDEAVRLQRVREALDEDIATRGPSTRSGALRGQISRRSSVSRQLAKLEVTWATGEPSDNDDDGVDRVAADGAAGAMREELLGSLALRDLLDGDLEHRGVSTPRGGERRQVAQRIQVSRDLVRLAGRIRTEARRAARSAVAPMSVWDVAREIAFDASQHPSDVIAAVAHLLTNRPPRVTSPELDEWEEKLRAMSEAEIDAMILELGAAEDGPQATPRPETEIGAATADEPEPPEAPGTDVTQTCLEVLQRIGDGFDPRASGRDRMRAAELRERHLAPTRDRDAIYEEQVELWALEDLQSLLAGGG